MASLMKLGKSLLGFLGNQAEKNKLAYQDTIRKGLVSVANLCRAYEGHFPVAPPSMYGLDDAAIDHWPAVDHHRAYAAMVRGLCLLSDIKLAGHGNTLDFPWIARDVTQLYASVRAMQEHGWEHFWLHDDLKTKQRQGASK